jgi:hypothetical protein
MEDERVGERPKQPISLRHRLIESVTAAHLIIDRVRNGKTFESTDMVGRLWVKRHVLVMAEVELEQSCNI